MEKLELEYYSGNYDAFVKIRDEQNENKMKQYNWEQDQIAHMKVGKDAIFENKLLCCLFRDLRKKKHWSLEYSILNIMP